MAQIMGLNSGLDLKKNSFNFLQSGGTLLSTNLETEQYSSYDEVYNNIFDEYLIDYLTNMDPVNLEPVVEEEQEEFSVVKFY